MIKRIALALILVAAFTGAAAADDSVMEVHASTPGFIDARCFPDVHAIAFFDESDHEVGRLDWSKKKVRFTGKADAGARIFFQKLVVGHMQPTLDARKESQPAAAR